MKKKAFSVVALMTVMTHSALADLPDQKARWGGTYQVVSSNDPSFPMKANAEYFMDFGQWNDGVKGRVSVSTRQNPNVRVRVFSWEFQPRSQSLIMGNPMVGESSQVLARVMWNVRPTADGAVFERGSYKLVLNRVSPENY